LGTELKRYRTPDQIGSVRVNMPDGQKEDNVESIRKGF